ncbi:MAG: hypothetical protein FJ125_09145, partial [Deltaproteobacteria bacterium]|nr:hypothetical protein [Deltaproteobacteria bacterium]
MLLLLPAVLPATACDGDGGGGGGKVGTDGGVVGGGQDIGGDGSPDGGPDGGLADAGPGGGGADGGGAADGGADGGGAADGGAPGFDDHTVATLPDLVALERLMVGAPGRRQAKFLVTRFAEGDQARIRYMDGSFYGMHDEWYWFTLLNGQPVAGETEVAPLPGRSFATVRQIVDWCRGLAELPLDLRFVLDGRLYSPRFYHLALDVEPRVFGLGGLLHLAAVEGVRPELWLFELEYSDAVTHETLVRFFELLDATLPPGIAGTLRWVVRSPAQEVVARQMEEQRLPYWDRLVRYGELAVPGETEVYS